MVVLKQHSGADAWIRLVSVIKSSSNSDSEQRHFSLLFDNMYLTGCPEVLLSFVDEVFHLCRSSEQASEWCAQHEISFAIWDAVFEIYITLSQNSAEAREPEQLQKRPPHQDDCQAEAIV